MTWWEAEPRARQGIIVRRRAWAEGVTLSTSGLVFVAGAGTTRAVVVRRMPGFPDAVAGPDIVRAADLLADDWEDAPL
jgi:hypothetical protein